MTRYLEKYNAFQQKVQICREHDKNSKSITQTLIIKKLSIVISFIDIKVNSTLYQTKLPIPITNAFDCIGFWIKTGKRSVAIPPLLSVGHQPWLPFYLHENSPSEQATQVKSKVWNSDWARGKYFKNFPVVYRGNQQFLFGSSTECNKHQWYFLPTNRKEARDFMPATNNQRQKESLDPCKTLSDRPNSNEILSSCISKKIWYIKIYTPWRLLEVCCWWQL